MRTCLASVIALLLSSCTIRLPGPEDQELEDLLGNSPDAAAAALLDQWSFEGGTVLDGDLPAASDPNVSVRLDSESTAAQLLPGQAGLLPLAASNPAEPTMPVSAALVQLQGTPSHFHIPRPAFMPATSGSSTVLPPPGSGSSITVVNLTNHFTLGANVCANLCNQRFSLRVRGAVELANGAVSQHAEFVIELDCTQTGSASQCGGAAPVSGGSAGAPSTSNGTASGASVPCAAGSMDPACGTDGSPIEPPPDDSVGGFVCGSGEQVPQTAVCNGISDCADESDEHQRCAVLTPTAPAPTPSPRGSAGAPSSPDGSAGADAAGTGGTGGSGGTAGSGWIGLSACDVATNAVCEEMAVCTQQEVSPCIEAVNASCGAVIGAYLNCMCECTRLLKETSNCASALECEGACRTQVGCN